MPIGEPIEHPSYLERLQQDLLFTDDSDVEAIEIETLNLTSCGKHMNKKSVGLKSA